MVNVHHFHKCQELVNDSAVYHCMLQMKSQVLRALKKQQGNPNKISIWAIMNDLQTMLCFAFKDKLNFEHFKVNGDLPLGIQHTLL